MQISNITKRTINIAANRRADGLDMIRRAFTGREIPSQVEDIIQNVKEEICLLRRDLEDIEKATL